jgi:iron complex transport system substrate-binding protein
MRIVSLIASATEVVCALGLEKYLVGRSHECDYPRSIQMLPKCTETKFLTSGTSPEIDRAIKAIVQDGTSVYRVYADLLRELRPDIIITQIQCEVCAVSEKDVLEALYGWMDYRPRVVSLNPNSLEDIWSDIRQVANACDVYLRGEELITSLQEKMSAISRSTRASALQPTVACIEWIEPLMAAGNWVPELVEMANGVNLFGFAGKHSPYVTWEDLVQKNPDVLVVMPCGWDIERIRQEMHFLTMKPEWGSLKAVQKNRVYLTDGNQYFNRPGPRVVESLEILAEIFHLKGDVEHSLSWHGTGWSAHL